jgi:hypothetical protein
MERLTNAPTTLRPSGFRNRELYECAREINARRMVILGEQLNEFVIFSFFHHLLFPVHLTQKVGLKTFLKVDAQIVSVNHHHLWSYSLSD